MIVLGGKLVIVGKCWYTCVHVTASHLNAVNNVTTFECSNKSVFVVRSQKAVLLDNRPVSENSRVDR
jgi:hypothetical protein